MCGNAHLSRMKKMGAQRARCRWWGRQMEMKMGLVTQLDKSAPCRVIGYTACMMWLVCSAHSLYVQLSCCTVLVEQNEDTGCLRAAPLLWGLVLKSGHEHVFPPSFHLPLHPPLSFCLLAPLFITSVVQPTALPFLLWQFLLDMFSVSMQPSAKAKPILLSLSASSLCFSLSMLISVIRLWGISWD